MPRKPKQQPQPAQKSDDDFVEDMEAADEEIAAVTSRKPDDPALKTRDWRAVEKYKEERELRQLIGDDGDLDDLIDSVQRRKI